MKSLTLTALDIGTNSIKGLTATRDLKTGTIGLLAQSQCPCFGVRNGEVVKPEQVLKSVERVKNDLMQRAGVRIKDVLVSINGNHLYSVPSQGLVSVSRADQKISREDIQRVIKASQAVNLPSNKEVLDVFPREFIVDGETGIKEPLGLQGIRLEVKVILACLFSPVLENLERAVLEAGLSIIDVVPTPIATSRAVLTQEQKELGVMMMEIGSGTSSISVFERGDLVDFAIFPIGSANITSDIAIGLRCEIKTAERIKKEFAVLKPIPEVKDSKKKKTSKAKVQERTNDTIEIPEKSLTFSRKFLNGIVEARMTDIFSQAQKSLKKIAGGEILPAGIVLTGGGSNLPGLVEYTKQKFKLPCRLGAVRDINGIDNPEFVNVAGVLLSGFDIESKGPRISASKEKGIGEKIKGIFKVFLP